MIPQQLKFSGIRDYRPTNLRFYSATNHVLITVQMEPVNQLLAFVWVQYSTLEK